MDIKKCKHYENMQFGRVELKKCEYYEDEIW